jgi:hypothetical protein
MRQSLQVYAGHYYFGEFSVLFLILIDWAKKVSEAEGLANLKQFGPRVYKAV